MFLKRRWFVLLVFVIIIIAGGLYFVLSAVTRNNFDRLETVSAERVNERVVSILDHFVFSVTAQVGDWAHWDTPWEMMIDPAAAEPFYAENLSSDALSILGVNLICYYDITKKVALAKGVSLPEGEDDPEALSKCDVIGHLDSLFNFEALGSYNSGFIDIGAGAPLLVVSSNIIKSDGVGPSHGYVVFASFLDNRLISDLESLSLFPAEIVMHGHPNMADDYKIAEAEFYRGAREYIYRKDNNTLYAYVCLLDKNNKPLAMLRSEISRDIHAQGESVVRSLAWISFAIGSLILMLAILISRLFIASKVEEDYLKVKTNSDQLREMNQILVGRELKMVELKERAAKLQRELTLLKNKKSPK